LIHSCFLDCSAVLHWVDPSTPQFTGIKLAQRNGKRQRYRVDCKFCRSLLYICANRLRVQDERDNGSWDYWLMEMGGYDQPPSLHGRRLFGSTMIRMGHVRNLTRNSIEGTVCLPRCFTT
jgi:hypothetical protein